MHRKTLMKGLLSVTTKGQEIPDPELKEGKKVPPYMAIGEYKFPENSHQPLEDFDSFYHGEVSDVIICVVWRPDYLAYDYLITLHQSTRFVLSL